MHANKFSQNRHIHLKLNISYLFFSISLPNKKNRKLFNNNARKLRAKDPGIADASSYVYFKRIVYTQKLKFCLHLHTLMSFQTCLTLFIISGTQKMIFWMLISYNQTILVHNDFHCVNKNITETFCKIKNIKQVWNGMRVRNYDSLHIWGNYPFKFIMLLQRIMGNVVLWVRHNIYWLISNIFWQA